MSEETFYFNFHGQYDKIHNVKTTTSMHILIKGPPSFSGPDRQILLPPLGGVWPRPGSGILVYLPPGLGHPRSPPHTKMSDPIPLTSLVFIPLDDHYRTLLDFLYSKDFSSLALLLPLCLFLLMTITVHTQTFYIQKIFSSLAHGTVPHTHNLFQHRG